MPRDFYVQNKRECRKRKEKKKCLYKFKKMIRDGEENRARLFKFQKMMKDKEIINS